MNFELAMSLAELKMRTSKSRYKPIKFLTEKSREFKSLSFNEMMVLCHLVRAAKKFDTIHFKLENHNNMDFLKFLDNEIKDGNQKAIYAKKMFLSQKSMFSPDSLGNQTKLVKGLNKTEGLGYFPEDLEKEEFHQIISDMLYKGKRKEVEEILNQRTIVVRDKNELKAIDFIDAFPEFQEVADELEKAKNYSSDSDFNEYLTLQIQALRKADANLDAEADKKWATLSGGKFEFTITRECYDETLTSTIFENKELADRLRSLGIKVYAKDSIGARVGIINKKGTKLLHKLKDLIEVAAKFMPYSDEYKRKEDEDKTPQTAVDVDVITLSGDEGAYQASLVLAQNLPNDDKPSLKIGGGRRNVYHRQVRGNVNKKVYRNYIADESFKYFNPEADHWAVICHENTHSLGPASHGSLGKYSAIMEEFKADMGMYAFLDEFVEAGFFTREQSKEIMVTSLSFGFLKGKPSLEQAHRVRSVMICNRMFTEKAMMLDVENKLVFDFEKVKNTAKQMMSEAIRLQLDSNVQNAKEYIDKWFVWTDEINTIAEIIKKHSKKLNGYLQEPLADLMLDENFEKIAKALAKS